jgi:hypothetical protein
MIHFGSRELLNSSVKFSLIVQIITGIITFNGLLLNVPNRDLPLKDVNILENIVQFIEGSYYVYIVYAIHNLNLSELVQLRYFDWVITTPLMLISTIMFMEYNNRESEDKKQLRLFDFVKEHKSVITKIVFYNFMMLLFGFLGEKGIIDKHISIPIGFIFFGLSFNEIYKFTNNIDINKKIFYILIVLWGLYGVAAMLPLVEKNTSYNILDMFSKNFYGLYIFYLIYSKKIN